MLQRLGTELILHEGFKLSDMLDTRVPFRYQTSPKSNMGDIVTRPANVIKLATWNVWNGDGGENYADGISSNERLKDLHERILANKPDFCGMQECYFNTFAPVSRMCIYPYGNAYFGAAEKWQDGKVKVNYDYGNVALCTGSIVSNSNNIYQTGLPNAADKENRAYTRTVFTVRGIRVCVYNTHLSFDTARVTDQMRELVAALLADTEQRIAVMGDFNHDNMALFQPLVDAGWTIGNNREFNTYNGSSGGSWFIDNIVFKGFSRLTGKGVEDAPYTLSDHKLFYVELEV